MDISIIIVSWKVKEKLRENLQSIFASQNRRRSIGDDGFNCEVFVVDNNSNDGTVEMVQNEFPQVKLVVNKKNRGFAFAVNQVALEAEGEYVLLLNPDMRVKSDTLSKILSWSGEHPEAGVVSCKLVDQHGEIIKHVRSFPTWLNQLAVIFKLPHLIPNILDSYLLKDFDYNKASVVDLIRGSFMLIREDILKKTGPLDERYFIWFEDVDYCRTVKKAGLQVWYTPEVECVDYVGQSFKQVKTLETQRYFRNSMLQYFKKWHADWQVVVLRTAWAILWPAIWLVDLLGLKGRSRT